MTVEEALKRLIIRANTLGWAMHDVTDQFDVELSELKIAIRDAEDALKGGAP